jgi:hypothetical protein
MLAVQQIPPVLDPATVAVPDTWRPASKMVLFFSNNTFSSTFYSVDKYTYNAIEMAEKGHIKRFHGLLQPPL